MRDFNHSIAVLVNANNNGTLEKGNHHACAAGNIVADAMGYRYCRELKENKKIRCVDAAGMSLDTTNWYTYMYELFFLTPEEKELARRQIVATGYTTEELIRIEQAFESTDTLLDGLQAVVQVLADIHNVNINKEVGLTV